MYEYISGRLSSITPANAVVDCCGVGYLLEITLNTYSAIQESSEVKLWVHEVIREDAHLLYGFYSTQERTMFRLLLGVNGVGAATARMMLSSLSVEELTNAIAGGDAKKVQRLAARLDELEDVQNVYNTMDVTDEIAEALDAE